MRRRVFAAAALVLALAAARPSSAEGIDLGKLLAAAVDLPTKEERAAAALKLALREEISLDEWLAAMRRFGAFERAPPGPRAEAPTLVVGGAREKTTIAVRVPPGYVPGTPAPLLLAFHGAGGEGRDEGDFWADAADGLGALVVAPTDPGGDAGYDFGETPRQRATAALRWARRTFDVDENRIWVTGVSRGGHLAWDAALRRPDQFAAMAPMIGGPKLTPEARNNLRYVENVAHLPIRDLQGMKDDPLLVSNLRMAFRRLAVFRAKDARLVEFPDMGHDFDPKAVDWGKFLGGALREPVPMRVVRACARLDEARSFWVEASSFGPSVKEVFRPDVLESKWKTMSEEDKREWFEDEMEKRTARIEAKIDGPGKFTVTTSQVQRFRLLLSREMFDPAAPVEIAVNGKPAASRDVRTSKAVLLKDFVERFDRTFLPVGEAFGP